MRRVSVLFLIGPGALLLFEPLAAQSWREAAEARIERIRKAELTVRTGRTARPQRACPCACE